MKQACLILCLLTLWAIGAISAQDGTVLVPELRGLNVPQASAALTAVGLQLGEQANSPVIEGQIVDTITTQIPAAGARAVSGSTVNLQIARANNMRLLYDDNDLTLINLSPQALTLKSIALREVDGKKRFRGQRWGKQVKAGDCVQVWSVRRQAPKSVPDCQQINSWMTTTNTEEHVWTTVSDVQNFNVLQDGQLLTTCPAAPSGSQETPSVCEFYIESGGSEQTLPYVYLAYTRDALVVRNPSQDSWLRLNAEIVPAAGEPIMLNYQSEYDAVNPLLTITNASGLQVLRQLAPNQCLLFRKEGVTINEMPQPCMMLANRTVETPFWRANFTVRGRDSRGRTCKAATAGRLTICIMPR